MASVRTDKVQLELNIAAEKAKTELDNLSRKQKVLIDEQKLLKKGTEEYVKSNEELKKVNARMEEIRKDLGLAGMTYNQLEKYTRELNREIKGLTPGTETFIAKTKELQQVNARTEEVRKSIKGIDDELNNSGNGFLNFVKKSAAFTGVYIGVTEVIGGLKQLGQESINSAARTSDSLADIQKSTGLTKDEVDALNESLKGIDTRTSQEDLQAIAIVGGQIGVARDEIYGFTEAVDKAVVALGDEFTGGAEEVAGKMGTLQKLFKETKDLDAGTAINKIGSAINALGADGSATGPVVADFTQRIGQLGDLAPEISQTLGLGAAFQELGLSAEISSGGLTNVLLTAAKDTAGFAAQIGVTEKKFTEMINSDPNEVILQLAESFKGASNTEITQTLDSLGIKSQEATKVMSLLATKTDFVRDKQTLASVEMEKATSLTHEFHIKNTTLAAELEKSEKQLAAVTDELGQGLAPAYVKIIGGIGVFVDIIRATPKFLNENKVAIGLLALGLLYWNKELIISNALALKDVAVKQIQSFWTTRVTVAQQSLNTSMRANPLGAIITAVSLLVMGFTALYNNSQTVRASIAGLWELLKNVGKNASAIFTAFTTGNWDLLKEVGKNAGKAFSDGYDGKIAEESKKQEEKEKKRRDKQIQDEAAAAENKAKVLTAIQRRQIDQYRKLVDESRDYAKALSGDELKKLQKALLAEQKKADEEKKRLREKQEKDELDAARKIQDYKNGLITDEYDRKIAQLRTAAEREKAEAKGTADQIKQQKDLIDKKLTSEIEVIEKARADARIKIAQETAKKETEIRRSAAVDQAELDVLVASRKGANGRVADDNALYVAKIRQMEVLKQIELEKAEETAKEKLAQDIKNLGLTGEAKTNYELESLNAHNAEKLLIEEGYLQKLGALNQAQIDKNRQEAIQGFTEFMDYAQQGAQLFADFKKIESDKEMLKADQDKARRLKNLDNEYKAGKISKEQYESAKTNIETNYDQKARSIKRKAAEDEKAANIANSIMAGILAVVKAGPNPFAMAATGLMAALSTAKIIATPIPTFGNGGLFGRMKNLVSNGAKRMFANGGTINSTAGVPTSGQLHGNGGIKMVDGATGEYLGEWEKGEPYMILSRSTYANNRPIIDSLLDSSLHRGGAPIKMAKGGVYADGGVSGPTSSGSPTAQSSTDINILVDEVRGLRQDVRNQQTLFKAYVVATEIEDGLSELQEIRSDAAA